MCIVMIIREKTEGGESSQKADAESGAGSPRSFPGWDALLQYPDAGKWMLPCRCMYLNWILKSGGWKVKEGIPKKAGV
jgi:hypothetical protein